ncbi:MAG: Tad domain-containing protein [Rhizobiaceae bacterium]|nr:Tad domain-containing protein [Rhizobiaceae bacterium]
MLERLKSLINDRRGNFAVIAGILMVPVITGIGLAVDYGRASHAKSTLFGAADAAAAGAVSQSSPTYRNGGTFSGSWTKSQAEADAMALFNANIVNNVGFKLEEAHATISQTGRRIVAKVHYTATVPMTFMRVFGKSEVPINGEATAVVDTAPYVDFYLLLDNSPSMGLGATTADIANLEAKTPDKCAFACHTTQQPSNNYYEIAKKHGIMMRIDLVRIAAQNLFDKAKEIGVHNEQFRMGTYTFGASAENLRLEEVAQMSADLDKGKKAVGAVDLMTIPSQGYDNDQQTPFDKIFSEMTTKVGTQGDGSGPGSREKIVFFVSDGVADHKKGPCTGIKRASRCHEPIDPKICRTLKERNIKVAVLYTTYQRVPRNGYYMANVDPYQPDIGDKMRECASGGLYFEVSPSQGIVEAMETLFLKVLGNPRITS